MTHRLVGSLLLGTAVLLVVRTIASAPRRTWADGTPALRPAAEGAR